MLRVWLIARREYLERIRTRGFIITTVMIPVILAGLIFGSIFMGPKLNSDTHIAVVSADTQLALDLQTELEQEEAEPLTQPSAQPGIQPSTKSKKSRMIVDAMGVSPDTTKSLDEEMDSGDLEGYLWITPASKPGERPIFTFTPKTAGEGVIKSRLAAALSTV